MHLGWIAKKEALNAQQESQCHQRNAEVPHAITEIVKKRIVALLGVIVSNHEPNDEPDRSQRKQAKIRSFAGRCGDAIPKLRAGNQKMNGEKRGCCGDECSHHVFPRFATFRILSVDRMLTR